MTTYHPKTTADDHPAQAILDQSWEYKEADTKYLTHNIHRYSGKFIPQIAARAISLLTQPGELVVDPYCGSGTTMLEAALMGRQSIGIDLNPLAVLIAKVKTTPIPDEELYSLSRNLANQLATSGNDSNIPLFQKPDPTESREPNQDCHWYRKWFQPHVLKELLAINTAIDQVENQDLRDFARVAFSNILRASSNAHQGYPNVMFDRNAPLKGSPIPPFLKTLKRNRQMVAPLSEISSAIWKVSAIHANAKALPLASCSVDAVISHPPYVGSIPYAEYGALSLTWLGMDPKLLDKALTGGHRQSKDVVERFEAAYRQMIQETHRVLKLDRYAFLMVGNPTVRGQVVSLDRMTLRLADDAGLQFAGRAARNGTNRRANNMGQEHLLLFSKPS